MGKNRDGKPQKEGTEGLHFRGQVEDPAVKSKNDRKLEKCYRRSEGTQQGEVEPWSM
jgi:hypothetical protein